MTSPICLVNGTATSSSVAVTPGSTVTIRLDDPAGAESWAVTCYSTSEDSTTTAVNATLSVTDAVNKIAEFTFPATYGTAVLLQSVINGGVDSNGRTRPEWTTTFKVYSAVSGNNLEVAALNETSEAGPYGWTGLFNATARFLTGSSGSGTGGADPGASYVTLATTASLANERALTAGTGILITDAGAGSTVTLGVNNGVVATISGSVFTGAVTAASAFGFTGSLTKLAGGTSFIQAGQNITVTTGSLGQVTIAASAASSADVAAQYLTLAATGSLANERVFTPGTGLKATDSGAGAAYTLNANDSVLATISGSVFTGAVTAASAFGFTGSLTKLVGGAPYITAVAGNVITITTGSGGQIIFSGSGGTASGGSSGGGDPGAQYLTLAATSSLSLERVFTPGSGLFSTDAGAGGAYTVGVNDRFFAALTGSNFTGAVSGSTFTANSFTASLGVTATSLTGSLTKLASGISYLVGIGGVTITSQSNGQVFISASAGGSGGSGTVTAQYLTLATDATLTAERVLTPSTGLFATDGGANGAYTIGVNDRIFAALTGSVFSGNVSAAQLTGSLTKTQAGLSAFVGVGGVSVTTASNGQVIFSSSIGGGSQDLSPYALLAGATFTGPLTASLGLSASFAQFNTNAATTGRIRFGGAGSQVQAAWSPDGGANNHALITSDDSGNGPIFGATTQPTNLYGSSVTVYGGSGDVFVYGGGVQSARFGATTATMYATVAANAGLSGSLTKLIDGTSAFIAGANITITSASNGAVTIAGAAAGSGGGGDPGAQYLVLANTASLSNERAFAAGSGIFTTDAGANSTFTIGVNDRIFAALTGANFTGPVSGGAITAGAGFTGSLTRLLGGVLPFITSPSGNVIGISTGSNGQIIISGSNSGTGAPVTAQYLTLAADATLTVERVFTPSTGLFATDAGAGAAYSLGVNDRFFAALTGSIFTGAVSHDGPGGSALTKGTDVFTYFSGSCGLTGSAVAVNVNRKATVFAGDLMLSGTFQEQRPVQSPKAYKVNYFTQSVTANATPFVVGVLTIPSGSAGVAFSAVATSPNVSTSGFFSRMALFRNQAGTVTQEGVVGGTDAGSMQTSGSAMGIGIDKVGNQCRLVVTGSSVSVTWAIDATLTGVTP